MPRPPPLRQKLPMRASLDRIPPQTGRKSLPSLSLYSQLAQPKLPEPFALGGYKDFFVLPCWSVMNSDVPFLELPSLNC